MYKSFFFVFSYENPQEGKSLLGFCQTKSVAKQTEFDESNGYYVYIYLYMDSYMSSCGY